MNEFNPDAYVAAISQGASVTPSAPAGSFDPDAYVAAVTPPRGGATRDITPPAEKPAGSILSIPSDVVQRAQNFSNLLTKTPHQSRASNLFQAFSQPFALPGDIANRAVETIGSMQNVGGRPTEAGSFWTGTVGPRIKQALAPIASWAAAHPEAAANLGAALNYTTAIPLAGAEAKAGGEALKAGASVPEALGEKIIEKAVPRREAYIAGAGQSKGGAILSGEKRIAKTVAEQNLGSPLGFTSMIQKAKDLISAKQEEVSSILADKEMSRGKVQVGQMVGPEGQAGPMFESGHVPLSVDIDAALKGFKDDAANGKIIGLKYDPEEAAKITDKITAMLSREGLTGKALPVTKMPAMKRLIDNELDLFKGGPSHPSEALVDRVGEQLYHRMKDHLNEKVPEIEQPNRDISDLINAKDALEAMQSKVHNPGILNYLLMGLGVGGGAAVTHGSLLGGLGGLASGSLPLLWREGRGPGSLLTLGRMMEYPASVASRIPTVLTGQPAVGTAYMSSQLGQMVQPQGQ